MRIIFPEMPYNRALESAGLKYLFERRVDSCQSFIKDIGLDNPLYKCVSGEIVIQQRRSKRLDSRALTLANTERFSDFVTHKYALYQ